MHPTCAGRKAPTQLTRPVKALAGLREQPIISLWVLRTVVSMPDA